MYKNIKPLHSILTSKWTPLLPAQSVKISSLGQGHAVNIHYSSPDQHEMDPMPNSTAKYALIPYQPNCRWKNNNNKNCKHFPMQWQDSEKREPQMVEGEFSKDNWIKRVKSTPDV